MQQNRRIQVIQKFLPLLPEGAEPVNKNLAIFRDEGEIIFFNGYCPMLKCSDSDPYDMRLAQGVLCATHIVKPAQLAVKDGQFEADLGGHILKKRIRFQGKGKSKSGRTIIC
jgi:hypothetical protein